MKPLTTPHCVGYDCPCHFSPAEQAHERNMRRLRRERGLPPAPWVTTTYQEVESWTGGAS